METLASIAQELRSALRYVLGGPAMFFLTLLCVVLCMDACQLHAQDDERPPEPKPPVADPGFPDALKQGTLDLSARIYLPDKNGVPRLVPNVRLSDVYELTTSQGRRGDADALPTYKIDQLQIDARVDGKLVEVRNRIALTLNELAQRVTAIPLKLQNCLLTQVPQYEGPGQSQLQIGRNDAPGYVWWLQAEPKSTHSIALIGQSAIQVEGDRQSFQLNLPGASSTIELVLPAAYRDFSVRGQGGEQVTEELKDGSRKVLIKCNGGDVNISWRTGSDSQPSAGAIELTSNTRWTIDDPASTWEADSELSLRAHGDNPIEKLVVELPVGAHWIPTEIPQPPQYTVTPEATDEPNKATRLVVQAANRLGLVSVGNIPIRWRWTPPAGQASSVAVPGLVIQDADRHEGTATLVVPATLSLQWKSAQGAELVQQSSLGTLPARVQYVFRFARQGQALNVGFRRDVSLADVKPTYVAHVDRDGIRLTGWLKCEFDQTQQPELAIDLGPWQLDSAEVIADMAEPMADGKLLDQQIIDAENPRIVRLSSPLDPETVSSGRTPRIWRIVAYASRESTEDKSADLRLPVPTIMLLATDQTRVPLQHVSGSLLVTPSDNVLLTWNPEGSQSLLTDALSASLQALSPGVTPDRIQAFRFQSGSKDAPVWIGKVDVLPRRVAAQQTIELAIHPELTQVIQRFQLQIANESLPMLVLDPHGAKDVSVLVDDVPWVVEPMEPISAVAPTSSQTPDANNSAASSSQPILAGRLRAKGTENLLGKVKVEIRSGQTLSAFSASPTSKSVEEILKLPLVSIDVEDVIMRNPVAVTATVTNGLTAWLAPTHLTNAPNDHVGDAFNDGSDQRWQPIPTTPFDLPLGSHELEVRVARQTNKSMSPVRVTGAWLQTALSGTTRADRFCAKFITDQDSLTVRLPAYDLAAELAIDGVRQSLDPNNGRLQISLREFAPGQEHTLELWMRSANTIGWLNKIEVDVVNIEGCPRFEQFYWQLVTSNTQHLLTLPETVTAEWRWIWDRLWWQRHSPLDQADFEQWLSATVQLPLAPAANRYVASSFGAIAPFKVWIASRVLLWLPIGLVAIGGSVLVSLFRPLRHPSAALLLIACVLGVAAIWSDLAILIGQTSLLALLIVLLYAATQAAIESRVRRRSIFSTRPISGSYESLESPSLVRPASHGSSEIVATTRTQSPIVSNGGG